ncbi:MAG TPA: ABC transporter permease [Solirubrobacteraceae bacterium]|jgi:spermidine/putrescine transport system permease protein|nr:ABC transporter permease [Solirubrobacteraceae bacterium]
MASGALAGGGVSRAGGWGARRRLAKGSLVLPAFGWTAVFFVIPLILLIAYSFGHIDIITFTVQWGWTTRSYSQVFQSLYLSAIGRSLLLSSGATVACLLAGFPVAYYISLQRGRRQLILLVAIIVPFWTSFLVRTYAMTNLLNAHWLGSGKLLDTPFAVGLGIFYTYLPLMVLPLYVALERIDPALRESAADLGAGGFSRLRRVIIPLAMPGIVAGCILVGVPSTGEYVIPSILGGGKVLMYGNVVADQFQSTGNYPFGAALAVSLMAALTVVVLAVRRASARREALA